MSTSLLVKRMQEADINQEFYIYCRDVVSGKTMLKNSDIVLIAPHISYMKYEFIERCELLHIPLMVIDTLDYTKMNGKAVLEKANHMIEENNQENIFKIVLLHAHTGAMSDLIALDMRKKRSEEEENWIIESCAIDDFFDDENISIVLIEPQIKFEKENIKKRLKNTKTLIEVPSLALYGTFDGRKVLNYIHQIYDHYIQEKMKEGIEDI